MTNRNPGRSEGTASDRSFYVAGKLGTIALTGTGEDVGEAVVAVPAVGTEAWIGRELMRLECAREAVERDIFHLRELQGRKVS